MQHFAKSLLIYDIITRKGVTIQKLKDLSVYGRSLKINKIKNYNFWIQGINNNESM